MERALPVIRSELLLVVRCSRPQCAIAEASASFGKQEDIPLLSHVDAPVCRKILGHICQPLWDQKAVRISLLEAGTGSTGLGGFVACFRDLAVRRLQKACGLRSFGTS